MRIDNDRRSLCKRLLTANFHDRERNKTENAWEARNNPFPVYSGIVFIVFVFMMTIIIMNMMVGLAVDDIVEIQNNAEFSKLSLNVRLSAL